jgi:hypothetical protein
LSLAVADFVQTPMSPILAATLARASEAAELGGAGEVTLEHLLAALCEDSDAINVFDASRVSIPRLAADIADHLRRAGINGPSRGAVLAVSPGLKRILEAAAAAAQGGRRRDINGAIVLAAIVGDGKSAAAQMLQAQGLTFDEAIRALQAALSPPPRELHQHPVPAEDVLARARERVQSRAAPSLRDIMTDSPRSAPPPPLPLPPPQSPAQVPVPDFPVLRETPVPAPQPAAAPPAAVTAPIPDLKRDPAPEAPVWEPANINLDPLPAPKPAADPVAARMSARASTLTPGTSDSAQNAYPPLQSASESRADVDRAPREADAPPAKAPPEPVTRDQAEPPKSAPALPNIPALSTGERPGGGYNYPSPASAPPRPMGVPVAGPPVMPSPFPPVHSSGFEFPRPTGGPMPPPIPPPIPRPMGGSHSGPPMPMPYPGAPSQTARGGPPPIGMPTPPPSLGAPGAPMSGGVRGGQAPGVAAPAQAPRTAEGAAKRRERTKAVSGQLAENIPRTMKVGRPERVEIRIAKADAKALSEGLEGGGAAWTHDVTITKAMSVRLRAPEGGFFIESASPETQWIESQLGFASDDFASWRFLITPRTRGRARLQIIVSARTVGSDGVAAETALPDQVIEVKVRTNYGRALLRLFGWVLAAIAGGVLARFGDGAFDMIKASVERFVN